MLDSIYYMILKRLKVLWSHDFWHENAKILPDKCDVIVGVIM